MTAPSRSQVGVGPFVVISDTAVDASMLIDTLLGKVAELTLENAVLRVQVQTWSALAHATVSDPTPAPERPSEGHTGADPGTVEPPSPGWEPSEGL
jgi:hypothetical protein